MSEWYEIEDPDDVELSDDGKTIQILFNTNKHGNQYVDVPVEFIASVLPVKVNLGATGAAPRD